MTNKALKIVPMPEQTRRDVQFRKREEQFLRACDEIERGMALTGYKGDVVFDLLQGLQGMYVYSREVQV